MDNRYFQDTRAVRPSIGEPPGPRPMGPLCSDMGGGMIRPPVVPGNRTVPWPAEPTLPRMEIPVPPWADFAYEHGQQYERPTAQPMSPAGDNYPPMSPPPWGSFSDDLNRRAAAGQNRGRPLVLGLLTAALMLLLLLSAFLVQRNNLLPVGVPVLGKDTGVAICEVMSRGAGPTGEKNTDGSTKELTATEIRKLRSLFADSRYEAIRINGMRMTDVLVQIEALGPDAGFGALAFIGSFADAYAGLAGGCADVGYPLPALPAN
jgi:hypothetical protein